MIDGLYYILVAALAGVHLGTWGILVANLAYLRSASASPPSRWPALSVCIPARNEAANLRRLLPSLLDQDYPTLEVHVWDDGSTDDTWAVLQSIDDGRLHAHRGEGPPDGWVGKVHALHQCTRQATGACYLFLDADAELIDAEALRRLVAKHQGADTAVTSGFPRLRGAAQVLVSLVPNAILTGLPWPLVRRTRLPSLSALNGQCWLIDADLYHVHEPHRAVRNDVLEDVAIGRLLKRKGHPPTLLDVQDEVHVFMYDSFGDAWRGFRKNAYLLLGGRPGAFVGMWTGFLLTWLVAPLLSLWFLASLYGLKAVTDRASGTPLVVTAAAPLSFGLGLCLQLDSALHHWADHVEWKGRAVPSSSSATRPPDTG